MKKEYSLCGVIIIIVTTAVISALSTGILIMRNYSTDDGQSYSEIIKDDDGNPTYDETWVSSVDVSVPKYMLGGTDGAFDTITSDEQLETIKADLLKKFFNCLIDSF